MDLVDLQLQFLKSWGRKVSKLSLIKATKSDNIRNSMVKNKMKKKKQYHKISAYQFNLPAPKMEQNIELLNNVGCLGFFFNQSSELQRCGF